MSGEALRTRLFVVDLQGHEKREILKEMTEPLRSVGVQDCEALVDAVMAREELETTAIGEGLAFPHARVSLVRDLYLVVGRSPKGVDFCSRDKRPVHLVFLTVAPPEKNREYLMTIARIAHFLKSNNVKDKLLRAQNTQEAKDILLRGAFAIEE